MVCPKDFINMENDNTTLKITINELAECLKKQAKKNILYANYDCFFYSEEQDMNAIIKTCALAGPYKEFNCQKCKNYIAKKTAYEIIIDYQKHIQKEKE